MLLTCRYGAIGCEQREALGGAGIGSALKVAPPRGPQVNNAWPLQQQRSGSHTQRYHRVCTDPSTPCTTLHLHSWPSCQTTKISLGCRWQRGTTYQVFPKLAENNLSTVPPAWDPQGNTSAGAMLFRQPSSVQYIVWRGNP